MAMFRNVNLAPIDTSGFERAGAAYGQMFQNLGNTIASSVEKYRAKQEKQESKDSMRRIIKNLPSEALEQLGVDTTDPKMVDQMASDMVNAPGQTQQLLATISSLTTADNQRKLNMQKGARDALTYRQELMKEKVLGMVRENPNNPELGKYPIEMVQEALVQAQKEQDEAKQRGASIRSTELGNIGSAIANQFGEQTLSSRVDEQKNKASIAKSEASVADATVGDKIEASGIEVETDELRRQGLELDNLLKKYNVEKGQPLTSEQFNEVQADLKEKGIDAAISFTATRDGKYYITAINERSDYVPADVKLVNALSELEEELAITNNPALQKKVERLNELVKARTRQPTFILPPNLSLPPQ